MEFRSLSRRKVRGVLTFWRSHIFASMLKSGKRHIGMVDELYGQKLRVVNKKATDETEFSVVQLWI